MRTEIIILLTLLFLSFADGGELSQQLEEIISDTTVYDIDYDEALLYMHHEEKLIDSFELYQLRRIIGLSGADAIEVVQMYEYYLYKNNNSNTSIDSTYIYFGEEGEIR